MSSIDKKDEKNPKEKNKREYLVLKKYTGEKVYYPSDKVKLDPDSEQTKHLLTNKFIR